MATIGNYSRDGCGSGYKANRPPSRRDGQRRPVQPLAVSLTEQSDALLRRIHRWDMRCVGQPLSRFRWLQPSALAPIPNCLDFGWRGRRLQKSGSLARTCGNGGLSPQLPPRHRWSKVYRRGQIMIDRGIPS